MHLGVERAVERREPTHGGPAGRVGDDSVYDYLAIALGPCVLAPRVAGISDHFDLNHRPLRVLYVGDLCK